MLRSIRCERRGPHSTAGAHPAAKRAARRTVLGTPRAAGSRAQRATDTARPRRPRQTTATALGAQLSRPRGRLRGAAEAAKRDRGEEREAGRGVAGRQARADAARGWGRSQREHNPRTLTSELRPGARALARARGRRSGATHGNPPNDPLAADHRRRTDRKKSGGAGTPESRGLEKDASSVLTRRVTADACRRPHRQRDLSSPASGSLPRHARASVGALARARIRKRTADHAASGSTRSQCRLM